MDEYLKWLNEMINSESDSVSSTMLSVIAGDERFKKTPFNKHVARHQAFVEARQRYVELMPAKLPVGEDQPAAIIYNDTKIIQTACGQELTVVLWHVGQDVRLSFGVFYICLNDQEVSEFKRLLTYGGVMHEGRAKIVVDIGLASYAAMSVSDTMIGGRSEGRCMLSPNNRDEIIETLNVAIARKPVE